MFQVIHVCWLKAKQSKIIHFLFFVFILCYESQRIVERTLQRVPYYNKDLWKRITIIIRCEKGGTHELVKFGESNLKHNPKIIDIVHPADDSISFAVAGETARWGKTFLH